MTPGLYNPEIFKGSPWKIKLTIKNPDGSPKDLTGWTGRFQLRASANNAEVLAEGTVTFPAPIAGRCDCALTGAQTRGIPTTGHTFLDTSSVPWDLYLTEPGQEPVRWVQGVSVVSPGITQ